MTTKQRFRNNKYRLEVRERDHSPAHCHLVGAEVMAWVQVNLADLRKEWHTWHT